MKIMNVLHIDDDDDDLNLFAFAVRQINSKINLSSFKDPLQAFLHLQESILLPDLIFIDLNMPVINGSQVLIRLKKDEAFREVPTIILSTSDNSEQIKLLRDLGATDYIVKPNSVDSLVISLRRYIS